jgi:hypothetical protein
VRTPVDSLSQEAGRLAPASPGLCSPVAHPAAFPRRHWGLPGSWADPCARAPLSDPGGTSAPGHCGASMLPVTYISAPAPTIGSFEALSRGIRTRCLRFAGRVAPPPRKTRFRLVASLCRAGLPPAGSATEGFRRPTSSRPPSPGFAWRNTYEAAWLERRGGAAETRPASLKFLGRRDACFTSGPPEHAA